MDNNNIQANLDAMTKDYYRWADGSVLDAAMGDSLFTLRQTPLKLGSALDRYRANLRPAIANAKNAHELPDTPGQPWPRGSVSMMETAGEVATRAQAAIDKIEANATAARERIVACCADVRKVHDLGTTAIVEGTAANYPPVVQRLGEIEEEMAANYPQLQGTLSQVKDAIASGGGVLTELPDWGNGTVYLHEQPVVEEQPRQWYDAMPSWRTQQDGGPF